MFNLIVPRKGSRIHTNVTVNGSPILILSANRHRKTAIIQNQGSGTVFLGPLGVATSGASRGFALFAGATFTDNGSDQDWYAIGSGTDIVHVCEVT